MSNEFPRGVVTLVFTDIEGSSELWERCGAAFQQSLEEHNSLLREHASRCKGSEVKAEGDSFFFVFATAGEAVQFAVDSQRALAQHEWPNEVGPVRVRIGMHTGEPIVGYHPGGIADYYGPAVNRAARIASAAHGGQILASNVSYEAAKRSLPFDITFHSLYVHRLRGIGEETLWQICHPDLPFDFPPPNTLNLRRHNLPIPATPFIGRVEETARWYELLHQPTTRLLTLVGLGGIGKTRAALQLAELSADRFPDGVWWVELEESRSAEEMLQHIAHRLGLQVRPHPSIGEQVEGFLHDRQPLLVLDNAEQISDAAQVVNGLLAAAPRLKCLVTSRRGLELRAEHVVEVSPLPSPDAEILFAERARAVRADFVLDANNAADVAELCRRLDGVPLAIELATSRIVVLTPREIIQRLRNRFEVLRTRSPELPPRQRALRATIDWSYDLLSEDARSLFAQLAVFGGGFTLGAAEAVCEAAHVLESVEELHRHSLLRSATDAIPQQTRFLMVESLREYAAEKIRNLPDDGQAIRRRHADHFVRFAENCVRALRTADEVGALHRFEPELDNVRGAVDWLAQAGQHEECARLALALSEILQRYGFMWEALERSRMGISALERLPEPDRVLVADLLLQRASLRLDEFDWVEARQHAREAGRLYQRLKHQQGVAYSSNLLGLAARGRKGFSDARRHFNQALDIFQKADDKVGVRIVQNNLGLIELEDPDGDKSRASFHFEQAMRFAREQGDQRGAAEALTNLGVLAHGQKDWESAWCCNRDALEIEQALRDAFGVARALCNLGEVAEAKGELTRACRLFAAAERLFDEVGSPFEQYACDWLCRTAARLDYCKEGTDALRRSAKEGAVDELVCWALTDERSSDPGATVTPQR